MADPSGLERTSKTLFVRNLSFRTSQADFEKAFGEYGPIKSCFLVKDKETDKSRGFGYVVFSVREDAETACKGVKSIDGRRVFIKYADPSQKKGRKQKGNTSNTEETEDEKPVLLPKVAPEPLKQLDEPKRLSGKQQRHKAVSTVVITGFKDGTSVGDIEKTLSKLNIKKVRGITFPAPGRKKLTALLGCSSNKDAVNAMKKLNQLKDGGKMKAMLLVQEEKPKIPEKPVSKKKCKLIVRNLSFKCDEENLKKVFKEFGEITEVKIPVKSDGLKFGYGFVQFSNLEEASKALTAMNAKSIMGRAVAVDWAIEREKFQHAITKSKTIDKTAEDSDENDSDESSVEDEVESKPKKLQSKKKHIDETDSEDASDDECEVDEKDNSSEEEVSGEDEEAESDNEEDESEDDETDDEDSDDGSLDDELKAKRKNFPPRPSDVGEGKTLFIRNVSFDSMEEDLEELFSEFGKINSCRLVIDHETEHSKGVAFVKFDEKEDAEKCLLHADNEQLRPGGILLDGRKLLVRLAIAREDAKKMAKDKEDVNKKKDSRNLWLLREGMIRAGTQAAEGLLKDDLRKREQIDRAKRQKLKNPEIFVSPTRLCVHNIPTNVQDAGLRKTFLKAAQCNSAKITECRIMRDLDRLNASGLGKSRGYGFVAFENHEHALAALRHTNNNPDLFGPKKRLIVEFSLENRAALRTKQMRLERAKVKQQMFKKEKREKKRVGKISVSAVQPPPKGSSIPKGMPSHMGPKIRHKDRGANQQTKKQRQNKQAKNPTPAQSVKRQSDSLQEAPTKKKKFTKSRDRTDDIDKLVAKYRNTFERNSMKKLKKWFDP